MNNKEILSKYAETISRIKVNLGKIENPDRDYQALFDEYCDNPKNRQLGKLLQAAEDDFEQSGYIDEEVWQARLEKWDNNRKKNGKQKVNKPKPVAPTFGELRSKRLQLEKELERVKEQIEQHKFDDFDKAVKSLLEEGTTKKELISRINKR